MLDKALNLKDKIPDVHVLQPSTSGETDNPEDKLQGEIDTFIQEGVSALEIMGFANYELNAHHRECINQTWMRNTPLCFLYQCQSMNSCLEEIDKTNKVVKKAMGQSSYSKMRQYKRTNFNKNRGRNQRSYSKRNNYLPRPFLGKHPSPSNSYQRHQKGGKGKESKN